MNVECTLRVSRIGLKLALACVLAGAMLQSFPGAAQSATTTPAVTPLKSATPNAVADSSEGAATVDSIRKQIDTGHPAEALKGIAELRSQAERTAGLNRLQGLALYEETDLKGADAAFAQALIDDPNDLEAAQLRGLTQFGLGHPAEAIPLLRAASAKGALGRADPNYILALCYMDTRQYDHAREAFAAQFGFAPSSGGAYLVTARMLFRREYLPIAQQLAEKSLQIQPGLPLAHELLGEIALAGNHFDVAIAEFQRERTHNPLEPSIYYRLGDAYTRSIRYDDAQRSLQEAILLDPTATGPYILLGKVMEKKGDPIAAVTYLRRAEALDPANYMTHNLLAQAYRTIGRVDDAKREAELTKRSLNASDAK